MGYRIPTNFAKVGVEGSNPFARSSQKPQKTAVFSGFFVPILRHEIARSGMNRTRICVSF